MINREEIDNLPNLPYSWRSALPLYSGVYFVLSETDELLYIGKAFNLRYRWSQHHKEAELASFKPSKICWLKIDLEALSAVESSLINAFRPKLNHIKESQPKKEITEEQRKRKTIHQRNWRHRKKNGFVNLCGLCGGRLRSDGKPGLCQSCWLKTPEGKAYNQDKVYRSASKIDAVAESKAIASKFSSELGFVNSAALQESELKQCVDVLPGVGFAHWHHRRDGQTTIYSLAVLKEHQGQGWGRLLFYRVLCSAIEHRAANKPADKDWRELEFSIVAKCPIDLPSNDFYARLGFELESVDPGKKRPLNLWRYRFKLPLLFYCGGGGKSRHDQTAKTEGWRLGLRSNGKNKAHEHMQMVDNEWGDGYDHAQHSRLIKHQKPLIATIRDIESIEQLPEALKHARELAPYCGRVMLIPKVKSWLPDRYWLGYSIPTGHGGTKIEPEWFGDRLVHLLGGNANDQASYSKVLNVVSLDHNAAMQIADYGKAMHQYCSSSGEPVHGGCYEAMRVSFQKQRSYWHETQTIEQMSLEGLTA